MLNPMIGMPQGAEWLVILAIVVLVFGAAKLPDLARGTGQALRIFKAETKGLRDDDDDDVKDTTTPPVAPPPVELPPTTPQQPIAQQPIAEQPQAEDRQADKNNG
jgi:sec-independent protein translocase protein TatA